MELIDIETTFSSTNSILCSSGDVLAMVIFSCGCRWSVVGGCVIALLRYYIPVLIFRNKLLTFILTLIESCETKRLALIFWNLCFVKFRFHTRHIVGKNKRICLYFRTNTSTCFRRYIFALLETVLKWNIG